MSNQMTSGQIVDKINNLKFYFKNFKKVRHESENVEVAHFTAPTVEVGTTSVGPLQNLMSQEPQNCYISNEQGFSSFISKKNNYTFKSVIELGNNLCGYCQMSS